MSLSQQEPSVIKRVSVETNQHTGPLMNEAMKARAR